MARPQRASGRRFLLCILLALFCAACSKAKATSTAPAASATGYELEELRYQGFSGQVTFPELADDLGYLAPLRLKLVGMTISGPQDIQSVVTGDVDFGGAFNGAIIKLIAASAHIRPVIGYYGIDEETWGGFFVVDGSPIHDARDLLGKKVAVNTLGAHMEFTLREYLGRAGLTKAEIDQVTLVVVPPVSGEQALRQKQVDVSVLMGILRDRALERGGIHKLFSDYDLFGKLTAGSYVMRQDFLSTNPRAARHFVEAVAKAIAWAQTTPRDDVIARYTRIIQARQRNEDASVVKFWRSTGVAQKGGVIVDHEYQIWLDWLVKDGQLKPGQLRAHDLYTNELNPFANQPI